MKAITYHVTLLEPALITMLEGDPNSAISFDYLPGSVLRGMLVGRYRHAHNVKMVQFNEMVADANSTVRHLFFSHNTRYLNGYLVDRQGKRSLPTPRSWQQKKNDLLAQTSKQPAPIYEFALVAQDGYDEQWKGAEKRFCSLVSLEAPVRLLSAQKRVAVHTARERISGRPQSGGVYRYISLAPYQTFAAVILCADRDSVDLCDLLKGTVKLGGSRTGGYGLARLEVKKVEDCADWSETMIRQPLQADRIVLTLLSDALIRDEQGQLVANARGLLRQLDAELALDRGFVASQIVGGFNQKWGLPALQTVVLSMGSVFVCCYQGSNPKELERKLNKWAESGIGERRNEGFGRIAVNWYSAQPRLQVEGEIELDEDELPAPKSIKSADGVAVAKTMTRRLFRQQLEQWKTAEASRLGSRIQKPSNSQISRLRQIVQDALHQEPEEGRVRLANYFASLEKRQAIRCQFEADKIDGHPLLEWLRFRVNDLETIKEEVSSTSLPTIGDVKAAWTDELVYLSNLLLIDSVLARAIKLKEEEG